MLDCILFNYVDIDQSYDIIYVHVHTSIYVCACNFSLKKDSYWNHDLWHTKFSCTVQAHGFFWLIGSPDMVS